MQPTRADKGKLTLQFGGGEIADLKHWHYDTFRVHWQDRLYDYADTLATFALDTEGKPVSFTVRLGRSTRSGDVGGREG